MSTMFTRRMFWGVLLSLFFLSTLALSWPLSHELFVSPDENAAFVFANHLASTGRVAISESLNAELGGLLHPRSAVGYGDSLVPASFVGFILLLSAVGAVFGKMAMFLVTPFLAVFTIVLWRDCVRRVFRDELLADAAAFLLMIHPAFWYYSGRVMMHNVVFLAFLVIGLWWCLAQPLSSWINKTRRARLRLIDFTLAGVWFGTALVIRTSEIFWVIPALAIVFALYRSTLGWRAGLATAAGLMIMFGLLGAVNSAVYGGPFINGYTAQYPYAAIVISDTESSAAITEPQRNFILPFGFHEHNILLNVMNYGFKLYPWMTLLAIVGMLISCTESTNERKLWRTIAIFTFALSAWLAIVYGSWMIIDNPDPTIISLGNSHVRYWLPLFALSSLFAARAIVFMLNDRVSDSAPPRPRSFAFAQDRLRSGPSKFVIGETLVRQLYAGTLLVLLSLLSFRLVLFGHDGFMPSREAIATFEIKQTRILELTEVDSIIVVDRADKYLYPERRVVVPLRSEATYQALPAMLKLAPVYYFGITLPNQDIDYLNTQKLAPLNVDIELIKTMNEESLYRFTVTDP